MSMGRPQKGIGHVDKLEGDELSKERLRVILKTLSGEMTAREAQEALGIGESHFHALRDRVLQSGLDSLAPKASGRPAKVPDPLEEELVELRDQVKLLEETIVAERLRTEVAMTMPHVMARAKRQEKKREQQEKKARRKRSRPQRPAKAKKRKGK